MTVDDLRKWLADKPGEWPVLIEAYDTAEYDDMEVRTDCILNLLRPDGTHWRYEPGDKGADHTVVVGF